jgi:tetratricopeptide (TPR) repeat protein/TolB-like protein
VSASLWTRLREARLLRILGVYLAASWLLLQVADLFVDRLGLPDWFVPAAVLLLSIGLVIVAATAWVQSRPGTAALARAEELPGAWEVDLGDVRESVSSGRLPHLTWGRALLAGAIAFAVLVVAAAAFVLVKGRAPALGPDAAAAESAAPGVAVLPFEAHGPGLDVWHEGMVDLLSTNLDGAAGLRAIDSRTVLARWQEGVGGEGQVADLATMLEVARRTGARYALVGSAVSVGSDVRLAADVYEVEGGELLGRAQVEGSPDEVLPLVDRLSVEVLRAVLQGGGGNLPAVSLARVTTSSVPGLKAYLQGERLFRSSRFDEAIPAYKQAVEADSTFALALYRLGNVYGWSESVESDAAHQYVERASRLVDRMPEREALLVRGELGLLRGDAASLDVLRTATEKYPDDAEAWYLYGDALFHLGPQLLATPDEIRAALERSVALDPGFAPAYLHLIDVAFGDADSSAARRLLDRHRELSPDPEAANLHELAFSAAFGSPADRRRAVAAADTFSGSSAPMRLGARLWNPRFAETQERLFELALEDPQPAVPAAVMRVFNLLNQGKLHDALGALEDLPLPPEFVTSVLFLMVGEGLPVPPGLVEEKLALQVPDSLRDASSFFQALHAVDAGRASEAEGVVRRVRAAVPRLLAAGDSATARLAEGAALGVEGYALARGGDTARGLDALERSVRQATGYGIAQGVNATLRWITADVLEDAGRWEDALRYWRSFELDSFAIRRRARIHEELGQYEEAREDYELFAYAWRNADPELQPMVEDARAAARRLTSVTRE